MRKLFENEVRKTSNSIMKNLNESETNIKNLLKLKTTQVQDIKYDKGNPTLRALINEVPQVDMNSLPEEDKLEAVEYNPYLIRFIDNPSEEAQFASVAKDARTIEFINNPSEEVQLTAVDFDDRVINWIKNPTDRVLKMVDPNDLQRDDLKKRYNELIQI